MNGSWTALGGGLYMAEVDVPAPTMDDLERATDPLRWMVKHLAYKPGWRFDLEDRRYGPEAFYVDPNSRRYLRVEVGCEDSVSHEPTIIVHRIAVPLAYEHRNAMEGAERFLRRWLMEAVIGIERHEACEFFTLDGAKPFFPPHEEGQDPYRVVELPESEWPR